MLVICIFRMFDFVVIGVLRMIRLVVIPPALVSVGTRVVPITFEYTGASLQQRSSGTAVACVSVAVRPFTRARHRPGGPRLPPKWVAVFANGDNVHSESKIGRPST